MKNWRFLGIDDSFKNGQCILVGCVTEGNNRVEGFLVGRIEVDGLDSTETIIEMVSKSKFKKQIKCIFLDGITFGGFNVADIKEISENLGIPVISVMRKVPDFNAIQGALRKFKDGELRLKIIKKAGKIHKIGSVFVQFYGCEVEEVSTFLRRSKLRGNIPEALRLAHLVATAIVHGESRGKA